MRNPHASASFEMPPTGLEDGVQKLDTTNALVERDAKNDAIYADLIEILTKWPSLPAQVRAEVLAVLHSRQLHSRQPT